MRNRKGLILSVPYPIELNDARAMVTRQHTGVEFKQIIRDQFDEILRQAEKYPFNSRTRGTGVDRIRRCAK